MLKNAQPSELFIGAVQRAYYQAEADAVRRGHITTLALWDYLVIESEHMLGGLNRMFEWDESKVQKIDRVGTMMEAISRGLVPGLKTGLDATGRAIVVRG